MTVEQTSRAAIDVIGESGRDDYIIAPTTHADALEAKAPALAAVLRSSAISATTRQFEDRDRDALTAQSDFERTFRRANAMVLVTGILVGLVLATGSMASLLPEWLSKSLLVVFSLASVVTGALASKDMHAIKQGGLLEDWMSKRASAETARIDYFDLVTNPDTSSAEENGLPLELLQLEYFRRFQFDVQLAYYRNRGRDHRQEGARTLGYSSWAIAGAAIAAGSAGILGASVDPAFAGIGALGVVFTGLSSYASMREAVNQNRRNAERYERTQHVLEDLDKRLDEVRSAVLQIGSKALEDFVDAVHEQLSLEHRQWLGQLSEARGAFAVLDKTLKDVSSRVSGADKV